MARPAKAKPRRDDWVEVEKFTLGDGSGRTAVKWQNVITGEVATLGLDKHPLDNPNAVTVGVQQTALLPAPGFSDGADDGEDDEEIPEESAAETLRRVLQGFSDNDRANVKVYRMKREGLEYCSEYPADVFLQGGNELIRDEWGAGQYRIILYATNPATGKYVRRTAQTIAIAEKKTASVPAAVGSDALVNALNALNSRLAALENNRPDPSQTMMQTLAMFKAFSEAIPKPAAQSVAVAPVDPIAQMMQTLQLIDMLKDRAEPRQEPDDLLTSIAPKALDLLGGILNKQGAQPQTESLPMIETNLPTVPAPLTLAHPAPQSSPEPAQVSPDQEMIQLAISWLILRARTNADIEETAEFVFEKAPDEVLAVLQTEQWFDALREVDARFAQHRDYFDRVRARVLEIMREESDPQDPGAAA